jgi:hypothetical protein
MDMGLIYLTIPLVNNNRVVGQVFLFSNPPATQEKNIVLFNNREPAHFPRLTVR